MQTIRILGIRGIPAAHGGFETFAEYLAVHLQKKGWNVVVYCQQEGEGSIHEDYWQDIKRIHIPVKGDTPLSTIIFDWKSNLHASKSKAPCLTLGYNTAIFSVMLRLKGIRNVMNMDGIEWKRKKWGLVPRIWFWLNDWAGCWLANHLVADHPKIKEHLLTRVGSEKITTIAYGAEKITTSDADLIKQFDLQPQSYAVLIARAEPENSILEVVQAWSAKPRDKKLVILGRYYDDYDYHRQVKQAASEEVLFVGAIYDKAIVSALRYFALLYVHGHQVGGTNPSLVESLGAGNAILANDNPYNRWVCGDAAAFFNDVSSCEHWIAELLTKPELVQQLSSASEQRFDNAFKWNKILSEYEELLNRSELHPE